jgi:hypothetical protein
MEINLEIVEEYDGGREADALRRDIQQRFPNAIWERCGRGHKIII